MACGWLVVVWPADGLAISGDQERHPLLETHVHEHDCCPGRRQSVVCVREVGEITEELLPIQRLLANKVPKVAPVETLHDLAPRDTGKVALETGDEGEMPLPLE